MTELQSLVNVTSSSGRYAVSRRLESLSQAMEYTHTHMQKMGEEGGGGGASSFLNSGWAEPVIFSHGLWLPDQSTDQISACGLEILATQMQEGERGFQLLRIKKRRAELGIDIVNIKVVCDSARHFNMKVVCDSASAASFFLLLRISL
jgi:hypothetical protein